jgi:hypothetical protein
VGRWRAGGAGVLLVLAGLGTGAPAAAQSLLDPACDRTAPAMAPLHLDPHRLAELRGQLEARPVGFTRSSTRRLHCLEGEEAPRLELLPVGGTLQNNSAYPRIQLQGLRWAGRGVSFDVGGGVAGSYGPLSAAFAPVFAWHQNRLFPTLEVRLPGTSPHAWYWRPTQIDWPQRFGAESFWWSHPGESYVRVDRFGAAFGFSTETLRWGPARRNPLIMSGAAPGFPHVFLGTTAPVNIGIGHLSLELSWGHLAESDYFDGDPLNDTRVLAGLVGSFAPRGLPGLSLGVARVHHRTLPPEGWTVLDYLTEPYGRPFENRPGDTLGGDNDLVSIFARWVIPAAELEVYLEYGREDYWENLVDLLMELDHSAAVTMGLQKLVPFRGREDERRLRVAFEVTSLVFPETQRSGRPELIWYTHSTVRQGHTHRGQLLGAPIGPASDAQALEIDILTPRWVAGVYVERIRHAADIYWQVYAPKYTNKGHDLEVTGGLRGAYQVPVPGLQVFGDLSLSGRYNRGFVALNTLFYETSYERNVSLQVGASWRPASLRSAASGGPASRPTPPATGAARP